MASRRKKAHVEEEAHADERWLLTYADMITLLMVLFIVLFAIGQVDKQKFDKLHDGLAESFGTAKILDGGAGILEGSTAQSITPDNTREALQALQVQHQATQNAKREAADMAGVQRKISAALAAKGLADAVQFSQERRGLVINVVTDRVLFELGSATLRPGGGRVLDVVAGSLEGLPNRLTVEGHTDNVPISGFYQTNWELSAERATTVLRYLLGQGIKPAKVSAAGYADQRPLVANDSADHRARNRRVAIVVLSTALDDATAAVPSVPSIPGA
jgi:chemotaxis protein MotB